MAVLDTEAGQVHADAYWTMVGVACELQRMLQDDEIIDYSLADEPFLPAQGGRQGAQVNASVSVPFTCPCD